MSEQRSTIPALWVAHHGDTVPTTREKLLYAGIEQIVEVGPVDFNAAAACEQLGIRRPMITHYFETKEKYIAEIAWTAYQLWAQHVGEIFRRRPSTPRQRLQWFVEGEVAWARKMGSVHTLINYPMVSSRALTVISAEHQKRMREIFEYHLALITLTVKDVRHGTNSDITFDVDDVPRASLLVPPSNFLTATQISWATHGLASWSSGRHLPTGHIENPRLSDITTEFAVRAMVQRIVDMAEK